MQLIDFFRGTLIAYVQFLLEKVPAAVLTLIFGWLAIKLLTLIVDRALKAAKAELTIASLFRAAISAAGWIIVMGAVLKGLGPGRGRSGRLRVRRPSRSGSCQRRLGHHGRHHRRYLPGQ